MFYIHQTSCISPQQTFLDIRLDVVHEIVNNRLQVFEPVYKNIPLNILRRMGKTVRIGVGAALPILQGAGPLSGIIIGTANGGMEESILFLKQIFEYDEGLLTPGSFVQSTPNATASQLSLLGINRGYNITHVHRGLAFENAIIDAAMMLSENKQNSYLLGGVDEIADYNYTLDYLADWYKKEPVTHKSLYDSDSPGTIAGEGAAIFLVNNESDHALAKVEAIHIIHTTEPGTVKQELQQFIKKYSQTTIDLFITGENGDNRLQTFYDDCEKLIDPEITIVHFKHLCGEYPTASSFALWLSCQILNGMILPEHMIKRMFSARKYSNILIYNNHKGMQHSFMIISLGN